MSSKKLKIALIGNPNCGKTSLFNQLTGLNQKIGNFPGVTVDKKTGAFEFENTKIEVLDLPGTYSLYPRSKDEVVVTEILTNKNNPYFPDLIVFIADASNLKRNLLLYTQLKDLGIPILFALNMLDTADEMGIQINEKQLSANLNEPIIAINARKGEKIDNLKKVIVHYDFKNETNLVRKSPFDDKLEPLKVVLNSENLAYNTFIFNVSEKINWLSDTQKEAINELKKTIQFDISKYQSEETISRYQHIDTLLNGVLDFSKAENREHLTSKLDRIFTHKIGGYIIFLAILFIVFQAIFSWSSVPMDFIDESFSALNEYLKNTLPEGIFTDLLTDGIVAGLGGVIIFIPQIAFLFGFISILEETGYMSRVVYLMDKIMRKFGLNGKSVVPLISGVACAVPSIMAARTIENTKDRLITIFVTPLMSCSARLPVYTIIIALVIPSTSFLGIFNLQGLVLMALYSLGFFAALFTALAMKFLLKVEEKGYFVMEMPVYRAPRMANVGLTIFEKVKVFVVDAGKIIVAISVVLWVLANFGPTEAMQQAEEKYTTENSELSEEEISNKTASEKLKASYAGQIGKIIEPVIAPLGFDWRIGIALVTSFAAREVFVGTMATIYSIGGDDELTLKQKMQDDKKADGTPFFTLATGLSILIFYAFAMQCMSTLAVVYRETKSWKWPVIQTVYLTLLAWCSSWVVFQVFS
jgi:ferrous iron transport protein B